jgi:hypothetical protein
MIRAADYLLLFTHRPHAVQVRRALAPNVCDAVAGLSHFCFTSCESLLSYFEREETLTRIRGLMPSCSRACLL